MKTSNLKVGVAKRSLIPGKPMFLVGYPHAQRISTGVHDPISATAFYLTNSRQAILSIAVDICYVTVESSRTCRAAISQATGIPVQNIFISATHTHSAPLTCDILAWHNDPVVPPVDPEYLAFFEHAIIDAGIDAKSASTPAKLAITRTEAHGVGRNRHSPDGAMDHEVGLFYAKREDTGAPLALLLIYGMHPTVMHEDSTLISSDFQHYTRVQIEEQFPGITVAYHNGTCGNLSPRYEVFGQTFAEAERLGRCLGSTVCSALKALRETDFLTHAKLTAKSEFIKLPARQLPTLAVAERDLAKSLAKYEHLKSINAGHGPIRTQECVTFGKEFVVRVLRTGEWDTMLQRYTPTEVQVLRIADTFIASLPGELFVEYGLRLKKRAPGQAFVVTMSNSDLHGYVTTPEAEAAGCYEAGFSTFTPKAGTLLVNTAVRLMKLLS